MQTRSNEVMGEKADQMGLVAFETLPWACRFNEWGKTATVLGTKDTPTKTRSGSNDSIMSNASSARQKKCTRSRRKRERERDRESERWPELRSLLKVYTEDEDARK